MELFGAIFLIGLFLFIVGFILYKNLYYKGKRRVSREPDLLEAALLKKRIAEGKIVIDSSDNRVDNLIKADIL